MGKAIRYLLLGLVAYAVALVATFPAKHAWSLAAPRLEQSGLGVGLSSLSGTVWSGRAEQVSLGTRVLGRVSWEIAPWSLLLGRLEAKSQLQTAGGYANGRLAVDPGGHLEIAALDGQLPLAELLQYLPQVPAVVKGQLALNLRQVTVEGGRLTGASGAVTWHQAEVTVPKPMALGTFRMEIATAEDGGLKGEIKDAGGAVEAEGTLTMSPQGAYRLDVLLKARPEAPAELAQALGFIGRPDPQGRVRFAYSGRM